MDGAGERGLRASLSLGSLGWEPDVHLRGLEWAAGPK